MSDNGDIPGGVLHPVGDVPNVVSADDIDRALRVVRDYFAGRVCARPDTRTARALTYLDFRDGAILIDIDVWPIGARVIWAASRGAMHTLRALWAHVASDDRAPLATIALARAIAGRWPSDECANFLRDECEARIGNCALYDAQSRAAVNWIVARDANVDCEVVGIALSLYARRGDTECVRALLNRARDASQLDNALRCAVAGGHIDIAQELVENGADVSRVGGIMLDATRGRSRCAIEWLLARGVRADSASLTSAYCADDLDCFTVLYEEVHTHDRGTLDIFALVNIGAGGRCFSWLYSNGFTQIDIDVRASILKCPTLELVNLLR